MPHVQPLQVYEFNDNVDTIDTIRSALAGSTAKMGELQYSIHGFGDYVPKEFSYPAGVSGFGRDSVPWPRNPINRLPDIH